MAVPVILMFALVLCLIMIFVFGSFSSDLKEKILDNKYEEIRVCDDNLSSRLTELRDINNDMYTGPVFKFGTTGNSNEGYAIYKEVAKYLVGNDFVQYLVYYRMATPQYFYTSEGAFDYLNFWKAYIAFEGYSAEDFLGRVTSVQRDEIISGLKDKNGREYLLAVSPIPLTSKHTYAYSLAYIKKSSFDAYVDNIFIDCEGFLRIKDINNEYFYSYGKGYDEDFIRSYSSSDDPQYEGIRKVSVGGRKYYEYTVNSSYNRCKVTAVFAAGDLMYRVYFMEGLLAVALLGILAFASICCFILVNRKIKPINDLATSLLGEDDVVEGTVINEDLLLRDKIDKLKEEKDRVYMRLFFSNLLAEQYDERSVVDAKREYKLRFDYSCFCCMALVPAEDAEDITSSENIALLREKLEADDYELYVIVNNAPKSLLLFINCEKERLFGSNLSILLEKVAGVLADSNHVKIRIGVGGVYDNLLGYSMSFREAMNAAFYCTRMSDMWFMEYSNVKSDGLGELITGKVSEITSLVKKGKVEEVGLQFNDLSELLGIKGVRTNYVPYFAYSLALELIELARGTDAENDIATFMDKLSGGTIKKQNCIAELGEIAIHITENSAIPKAQTSDELLGQIRDTINECLCDSMLSLDMIAEKCNISPSYLSRYFKTRMNCTPMSYVEDMRMEIVKDKLKNTDMSLNDILSAVGYIDKSNFIRKFKRREGVTPITYRKSE